MSKRSPLRIALPDRMGKSLLLIDKRIENNGVMVRRKNHFLPKAYLKGFGAQINPPPAGPFFIPCDGMGNPLKRVPVGMNLIEREKKFEKKEIEDWRRQIETEWGNLRKRLNSHAFSNLADADKEQIAEFIAFIILVSKSGREIVTEISRDSQEDIEIKNFSNLRSTTLAFQERFLEMKWMRVDCTPLDQTKLRHVIADGFNGYTLLCGEMPAVFTFAEANVDEPNVNRIKRVWFPLTKHLLLVLNEKEDGYCAVTDSRMIGDIPPALKALYLAIDFHKGLFEIAKRNKTKIYTPAGFDRSILRNVIPKP